MLLLLVVIVAAVTIAAGGEDPLKEVEELIRGRNTKGLRLRGRSGWLQNLGLTVALAPFGPCN